MILDIHLEYCDDTGERFENIAKLGKPFNIPIIPVLLLPEHEIFKNGVYPSDYFYSEKFTGLLNELSKEKYIGWGQQGFSHYCPECFREKNKKDAWHENRCLHGPKKSVEEQIEIMKKGKNVIEDVLNVSPTIYVAPNHQFDENTKVAAKELGYKYFADRGIINVSPYRENGLIILPERDLGQKGEVFYTHYDRMKDNLKEYIELIENSEPLENIKLSKKPKIKAVLNNRLLVGRKRLRDLIKKI